MYKTQDQLCGGRGGADRREGPLKRVQRPLPSPASQLWRPQLYHQQSQRPRHPCRRRCGVDEVPSSAQVLVVSVVHRCRSSRISVGQSYQAQQEAAGLAVGRFASRSNGAGRSRRRSSKPATCARGQMANKLSSPIPSR
eukprot:scaffold247053_cov24-Tisochrysis_lutea.AAC.2